MIDMKKIKKFFKQLFCRHVVIDDEFNMGKFYCYKCGKFMYERTQLWISINKGEGWSDPEPYKDNNQ